MTHWVMSYTLSCGHTFAHVHTTEAHKRTKGQSWDCFWCGSQEIVRAEGRTS